MEEGSDSTRYWCHECSREVETITEAETINCSLCHRGFVEELDSVRSDNHQHQHAGDSESDRALSLWAPILLGMMSNPRRRRRFRQIDSDDNDENDDNNNESEERHRRYRRDGDSELDRELESIMRRRRRSSATILQLLQGIRAGMISESENNPDRDGGTDNNNNNRELERERERVILINPFNQTIIVQGGNGGNPFDSGGSPANHPIGSLGDYFVGPGLELLLQHLAENDPNRYGTPPAQKEAVEAMPTVTINENSIQCSVCLEDFGIGSEAKEIPCKHKFHSVCILPWLKLHSSCPVCRYQLPSEESKLEPDQEPVQTGGAGAGTGNIEEGEDGANARRFSVTLPWPFSSLFSSNQHLMTNPSGPSGSGSGGSGSGSGSPAARDGGEGGRRDDDDH